MPHDPGFPPRGQDHSSTVTPSAPPLWPSQPPTYRPARRRWPGVLAVAVVAGGIGALIVANQDGGFGLLSQQQAPVEASAPAADAPKAVSDAEITAAVRSALAADPALADAGIDVSTEGGVVRLEGPAPDEQARARADVLAAAPTGVLRVDNRLVVSAPPPRS